MDEGVTTPWRTVTYEQLISKLDKYDELRAAAATGWTSRANTPYQELFYVDVLRARGAVDFTAENAIKDLGWQIRCKYPTSSTPPPPDPGVRYEESRGFGGVVRRR